MIIRWFEDLIICSAPATSIFVVWYSYTDSNTTDGRSSCFTDCVSVYRLWRWCQMGSQSPSLFLTWHITACALLVRRTGFYRDSLSESVLAFRCALSWKQFCLGSIIFDRWIYFMFYRSAWWVASDEIISLFRHWLFIVPRYFPYWLLTAVHTLSLVLVWHRSGECLHHSRCIFGTQWQILSDASYPNLWIAQLDLLIHELELRDKSYEK